MSKTQSLSSNQDEKKRKVSMEFMTRDVSIFHWNKGRVIGRGSFGIVYLGEPNKPHLAQVAIKVAPMFGKGINLMKEKVVLEKFIGSDEIVQCIGDAFMKHEDNHSVYHLVLEYAAGGTLGDFINARGKLREQIVKVYLQMILKGLSSIHARGYVHSDLKPENILIFPLGNRKTKLKIADFGLSKNYKYEDPNKNKDENRKLKFRGSPNYMSPESLYGEIKPPLDIWSLGCVLVDMITGKRVWNECKTNKELLSKLVYEEKIPNIPEELSDEGKDFLRKCFNRNPMQRWSADMLLKHPYLVEENETAKENSQHLHDCFNRNPMQRWLSNILLKHLYLVQENEATEESSQHLHNCFNINLMRRWLADMLLKHLYLVQENETTKKTIHYLLLFLGFCTIIMMLVVVFSNVYYFIARLTK